MIQQTFKYSLLLIWSLISISCNAPRNNPLDPNNPDNNIGTIEGYIQTISVPHQPIPLTKVMWINDEILTETNNQGYFLIEGIANKNGLLIFEHSSYTPDTIFIDFKGKNKITGTYFLNSFPKILDYKFYSVTVNKYPSKQTYNLVASVEIVDEENDIDSVFIENIELSSRVNLLYNASTKKYESPLYLSDLNLIGSIDAVIGKDFDISVIDSENKEFIIGSSNIKRIIKEEIIPSSPSGRDTIETRNPTLAWKKFTPGFNFNYVLEIYTDELPALLMWQTELSSEEIEFIAEANLPSGDYFWVIWAVDEFQNRSRSKPSSFIVE